MTEKLFENNSYIRQFQSRIIKNIILPNNRIGIILDSTAFYPEGGGQPADHGQINGIEVLDVYNETGDIIHVTAAMPTTEVVEASINWARRFDHMQQHTGQHILSAACNELFNAATVGFHLGAQSSQIDLDIPDFTDEQSIAAELHANDIIFSNQAVVVHKATKATLHNYPIRKQPTKEFDDIRLVEIPGVDCCPCGGTHVATTGELGLIKIRNWERKNNLIRLDFICGQRALIDYQEKNHIINQLCGRLSVPVQQIQTALDKQLNKLEETNRQLTVTRQELHSSIATSLHQQTKPLKEIKIITHQLTETTPPEVTSIAKQLATFPATIALLAGINADNTKVHLQFCCSPDLSLNMGIILKTALPLIEGKGGGTGSSAQGGGSAIRHTAEALEVAKQAVIELL